MGSILTLKLRYNVKDDSFETETDIKKGKIGEVVADFLRTQMGLGSDTREPNRLHIYTITITLDLDGDIYHLQSDTGNDSLTTGIILTYLQSLKS